MQNNRDRAAHKAHGRRSSDRRTGFERRAKRAGFQHRLSWEDQRSQYWTRLLFCLLALIYFNFGGEAQVRSWVSLPSVLLVMSVYGIEILFFMRHADSGQLEQSFRQHAQRIHCS